MAWPFPGTQIPKRLMRSSESWALESPVGLEVERPCGLAASFQVVPTTGDSLPGVVSCAYARGRMPLIEVLSLTGAQPSPPGSEAPPCARRNADGLCPVQRRKARLNGLGSE